MDMKINEPLHKITCRIQVAKNRKITTNTHQTETDCMRTAYRMQTNIANGLSGYVLKVEKILLG